MTFKIFISSLTQREELARSTGTRKHEDDAQDVFFRFDIPQFSLQLASYYFTTSYFVLVFVFVFVGINGKRPDGRMKRGYFVGDARCAF